MSVPAHDLCMSIEEYLDLEDSSDERHEYTAGRLFLMVGATDRHNTIVSNLHRHIYDPVKEAGCRIYAGDMKVKIEVSQTFYYPDIMVTCEPFSPHSVFKSAPCLIIEVLSPATMMADRREKLINYRHLPSLVEYVLVYQNKLHLETYRKDTDANWHCSVLDQPGVLSLSALAGRLIELSIKDIYYGTGIIPD